jgi:hypothetical protein
MERWKIRGVMSVAVLCSASAACALVPASAEAAKPITPVTLLAANGATPDLGNFSLYVASTASGTTFGKQNGVDISVAKGTPAEADAAILSGQQHFAVSAFGPTATTVSAGIPLRVIDQYGLGVPAAIIANKSIKSFSQLKGQKICAAALNASPYTNMLEYAAKTGHPLAPSQFVVSTDQPTTLEYINAGTCAAGWVGAVYYIPYLATHPDAHILVSAKALGKVDDDLGGEILTSKSYASGNPSVVKNVTTAITQASRALYASQSYFIKMANKAFPPGTYTNAQLKLIYVTVRPYYALNGGMNKAALAQTYTDWAKFNAMPQQVSALKGYQYFVDPTSVTAAVKQLGVAPGSSGTQLNTYKPKDYKG